MTDLRPKASTRADAVRRNLAWLAAGFVVAFAVPFLFADLLRVPRDLYYGIGHFSDRRGDREGSDLG